MLREYGYFQGFYNKILRYLVIYWGKYRVHVLVENFTCKASVCFFSFAANAKLFGSRLTPPWPDFHECPICGRLYKYRSTLYRHVRYECGGARMKLVCPICGRRFSRPDNLRQHAITHTSAHSLGPDVTHAETG